MDAGLTRPSLLSRVRDPSNESAWREFENRYRDLVLHYCRGRGLQPADAEDVAQVVFLNLSRSLRGFRYQPQRGRFRDYLGRAVRNTITRVMSCPRGAPRALDSSVLAAVADDDLAPDSVWDSHWVDHHYRRAMAAVASEFEPQSIAVFERLVAGDTVEQVAGEHGMTAAAVHKVKQRVRDRLRDLIAVQVREEDEPDGPPEG